MVCGESWSRGPWPWTLGLHQSSASTTERILFFREGHGQNANIVFSFCVTLQRKFSDRSSFLAIWRTVRRKWFGREKYMCFTVIARRGTTWTYVILSVHTEPGTFTPVPYEIRHGNQYRLTVPGSLCCQETWILLVPTVFLSGWPRALRYCNWLQWLLSKSIACVLWIGKIRFHLRLWSWVKSVFITWLPKHFCLDIREVDCEVVWVWLQVTLVWKLCKSITFAKKERCCTSFSLFAH